MALSSCHNTIFCNNKSDLFPYSIVFNELDEKQDYSTLYQDYENLVDTIINSDNDEKNEQDNYLQLQSKFIQLYTKPKHILQKKYICIGPVDNNEIRDLLVKIELTKKYDNVDVKELDDYFGYNVIEYWKIDGYHQIKFIFTHIQDDDTIHMVKNMIMAYCNDTAQYPFTSDTVYLYCNRDLQDFSIDDIVENILKDLNINKKFSVDYLRTILKSYLIPDKVIEHIFSKYGRNINQNISQILTESILRFFIRIYYQTKPLSFEFKTHYKLFYPVDSFIFNYWNTNSEIYSQNITHNLIKLDKSQTNDTIYYQGIPVDRTFYIYNYTNITDSLLGNLKKDIDDESANDLYKHILGKLYPTISIKEFRTQYNINSNSVEFQQKIQDLSNTLIKYNRIIDNFKKFNENEESKKMTINISQFNLLHIEHPIIFPERLDMRTIFNELKLSYDLPFVKYRDSQSKIMVYKLFKPVTQKKNNQYQPVVSKETLQNWRKNNNYEFVDGELKELRGNPREISYKLRLMDIPIGSSVSGRIYKINEGTIDILYQDKIIEEVSDEFVITQGDLKVNDVIDFYLYTTIYADVELFKKGRLSVIINMQDFETNNIHKLLDNVTEKINNFINWLYTLDVLQSYTIYNNLIQTNDFERHRFDKNTRFNNFVYEYSLIVPKELPISYNEMSNVAKLLSPFVIINEKPFLKNESILYYDETRNKWTSGRIIDFTANGYYTIILSEVVAGVPTNKKIEDVPKQLIRSSTSSADKKVFELIFKRLPDFNNLPPLKHLVYKLNNAGISKANIVEKVMEDYDIDRDETITLINQLVQNSEVTSLDKLSGELGISIKIDYLRDLSKSDEDNEKTIMIYIENVKTLNYVERLYKFITFFFSVYMNNIGFEKSKLFEPLTDERLKQLSFQEELKETENLDKIQQDDEINVLDIDNFEFDENIILDEGDSLLLDEDEIVEEMKDEEVNGNIEEEKQNEYFKKLQKEIELDTAASETQKKQKNIVLEKLYETDPVLFAWIDSVKKPYAKTCQSFKRYPKVLTDQQKEYIDKNFPGSYSSSKFDINCSSSDDVKKFSDTYGTDKVQCNAIKWGSSEDNKKWYICPRIYDLIDNVSLSWYDLKFEPPAGMGKFEPLNDRLDGWRKDKTTGKDILDFNPSFKGRKPIKNYDKIIPTTKESLLFLPQDIKYTYPGFLNNSQHPKSLYVPCCFNDRSNRAKEAFGIQDEWVKKTNDYIQGWGKELGYKPYRLGLLPEKLYQYFGIEKDKCKTGELNNGNNCYLRRGVRQDHNSFLNFIANLKSDSYTDEQLIKDIIRNITYDEFITLNNGNLEIEFRNIGEQSSFQNYLEYLISDEYKHYKYFYDYLTRPHKWLFPDGLRLIIFDYKIENSKEKIELLCPYFIGSNRNNSLSTPVALAIRNSTTFEPICFNKNGNIEKLYPSSTPYIEILNNLFSTKCNEIIPSKLIDVAKITNKNIFTKTRSLNETIKILTDIPSVDYHPKYLLRDYYNKIISIYLNNGLIVPVYPDSIYKSPYTVVNIMTHILETKSFEDNIYLYKELGKLSNQQINIYPVKYFIKGDILTGFITNVGVYIPVKASNWKELHGYNQDIKKNSRKVDYNEIDRKIAKFEKEYKKNVYKEKIDFNSIKSILDELSQKYNSSKFGLESSITNDRNEVEALITKSKIVIPIVEVPYKNIIASLGYDLPISKDYTVDSYDDYIVNAIELSRLSDYKIKCVPIRGVMDHTNKQYYQLLIESDYKVNLSKAQQFSISLKEDGQYKILKLLDNPIIDKVMDYEIVAENNVFLDERIRTVGKLNYYSNIYEVIKYELYNILHLPQFNKVRLFLSSVLNNSGLTVSQKRHIILPFFRNIMDVLVKIDIPSPNAISSIQFPKISIEKTCSVKCIPEICIIDDIDKEKLLIKNTDEYISKSYSGKDGKLENPVDTIKESISIAEIKSAEDAVIANNEFFKNMSVKWCKIRLIDSLDKLQFNSISNRIMDELVRNSYKRSQILDTYHKVKSDERYKVHKPFEVLIEEPDFTPELINGFYKFMKKKYYRDIVVFDENILDYYIQLDSLGNEVSVDSCNVGESNVYPITWVTKNKKNLNNSDRNNVIILNKDEFKELYIWIHKMNTKLSRCDVGIIGEYSVKKKSKNKKLIDKNKL